MAVREKIRSQTMRELSGPAYKETFRPDTKIGRHRDSENTETRNTEIGRGQNLFVFASGISTEIGRDVACTADIVILNRVQPLGLSGLYPFLLSCRTAHSIQGGKFMPRTSQRRQMVTTHTYHPWLPPNIWRESRNLDTKGWPFVSYCLWRAEW